MARTRHRLQILLAIATCSVTPAAVAAEQSQWLPGHGLPGFNGAVRALLLWDPDGQGPQSDVLVAGGTFTVAGTALANRIAFWDGQSWHALGAGFNFDVDALAVYEGQLIAGGAFHNSGGAPIHGIARWDSPTSSWQPLGAGSTMAVTAMTIYNGQLVATGFHQFIGGVFHQFCAAWNGSTWQLLGQGFNLSLNALMVYNGELTSQADLRKWAQEAGSRRRSIASRASILILRRGNRLVRALPMERCWR